MSKRIQLDDAIRAAREAVGSPAAVARLRGAVAARIEAGGGDAGLQPTAAGGGAGIAKLGLLAVAGLAAVGGGLYLARGPAEPRVVAPVVVSQPAPLPPVVSPVEAPAPAVALPPEPVDPHPAPRRVVPRRSVVEVLQPAAAEVGPSEVELITRAQALVERQPAAANAVLDEHARAYPQGMLREEREVLRVDAELLLGRRERALELAREFVIRHPRSAHVRRFQKLIQSQEVRGAETHPATLEREE